MGKQTITEFVGNYLRITSYELACLSINLIDTIGKGSCLRVFEYKGKLVVLSCHCVTCLKLVGVTSYFKSPKLFLHLGKGFVSFCFVLSGSHSHK